MSLSNITESTRHDVFAYARQLRTTAFEMERWGAFSGMESSEKLFYAKQMDKLVDDGQRIERIFLEELHGAPNHVPVHNDTAYANLPLPQVLYAVADTLCGILTDAVTPPVRFGYAISGVRNVAEDVANELGEELETPFVGTKVIDFGIE